VTQHTLQNGQSVNVAAGQWDGNSVAFAGTSSSAGQTPAVTFTGANTLATITDTGSATATGHAAITLMPGGALSTAGLTVNHASLSISERPGTSVTFDGTSQISNESTLTATGYAATGSFTVNDTMNIDATSTVNMDDVTIAGSGTFHLAGADGLLRAGAVGSGATVVLDGGMLSLANGMEFLGTITDSTRPPRGSAHCRPLTSTTRSTRRRRRSTRQPGCSTCSTPREPR
jgi:hypothetical protein